MITSNGTSASQCDDADSDVDIRRAEDPIRRPTVRFSETAGSVAASEHTSYRHAIIGLNDGDEDSDEEDGDAAKECRRKRAQSVELPAGKGFQGFRGAVQQLVNRTSNRLSVDLKQAPAAENVIRNEIAQTKVQTEFGLQAAVRAHMVSRTTGRLAGAVKLFEGCLRKVPKPRLRTQTDPSSLWKRRYVTLVRQNRRGPFWKEVLLAYHKTEDPDSTPRGVVPLTGAIILIAREDDNGAAFQVLHAVDKTYCLTLVADSFDERERWLLAFQKQGITVKFAFCVNAKNGSTANAHAKTKITIGQEQN